MFEHVWRAFIELNLFRSSTRQQPSDIKQQRWTSRIFILCLISGLVILTFYMMLRVQTKLIQTKNPTFKTTLYLQLQREFNSTLQCPCTQINTPYGQFVQLRPVYHQVCSSVFASGYWGYMVRALLQLSPDRILSRTDFRRSYQTFYLLSEFCILINSTVAGSLKTFEQTQLVTGDLLSIDLFENQMISIIKEFRSNLANTFLRFFQFTRNITYLNQYGNNANIGRFQYSKFNTTTFSIYAFNDEDDNASYACSCANNITCKSQLGLYDINTIWTLKSLVPGLYRACFNIESFVQSTLECFYNNQDCVANIIDFYNRSWFPNNITLLNSSLPSRFNTTSTLGSILSELFIEYWNQSLNYSSYFVQCQAALCSYEILQRNSVLETITTVFGLIGGLAVSLRIFVPFFVKACISIVRCQQHRHINPEASSLLARLITLVTKLRNWLKQLNAFDSPNKTAPNNIKKQQRTTYVYFFLLFVTLFILIIYNSLAYSTIRFTVTSPSLNKYQQLQDQYGMDAVNCPCTQLSITYSSFIDFECSFHPVCTSQFVSAAYLNELFELYNGLDTEYATENAFTLQGTIFSHFQVLSTLCSLVKDAFSDARQQYLTSSLISASMIDYNRFDKQTNTSLIRFKSTLPVEFLSNLQLIRGIVQGNAFVSLYSTNWYPVTYAWEPEVKVFMRPQYYGNCNCLTSSSCTQPSIPFIQGYLVGCTPLEALLQSSIECLYEQACIELFTIYLNFSLSAPGPLKISETHFSSKDTVETLVEQMFIETCSSNVSYNQFFEQCHPLSCSVTYTERNSLIIVVTTLFGLYGGLTTALKLVVPFFVSCIYKIVRRRQQILQTQVQPCRLESCLST